MSVSSQCRSCITTLKNIIVSPSALDEGISRVIQEQLRDELERFSLWVGNIGALHPPESSLSLETRLTREDEVLAHVIELLEDLNTVLVELSEIVFGEREGMEAPPSQGQSHDDDQKEETELLKEVGACISRLFRISKIIRQASSSDAFAKALSRTRYQFGSQFDVAHVGEKYPKLSTEDFVWLRKRLGEAITRRRHYLCYMRDHYGKLDAGSFLDENITTAVRQQTLTKQVVVEKQLFESSSQPSTFFTKASSLIPGQLSVDELTIEEESFSENDARSYTTISRSTGGDLDTSATIRIPQLKELRKGLKKEIECPFCFRIMKFKNEKIWRQHVFSDLRTYVCTFPDCDAPYFSSINDWFGHELQVHRAIYVCRLCQSSPFQIKERYLNHIRKKHPDMLEAGEENLLLAIAQQPPERIPAQDCPCCSEWATRIKERSGSIENAEDISDEIVVVTPAVFKRHLASHLEQLALFAVPIVSFTGGEIESNVAADENVDSRLGGSWLSALSFVTRGSSSPSSSERISPDDNTLEASEPIQVLAAKEFHRTQLTDMIKGAAEFGGDDKLEAIRTLLDKSGSNVEITKEMISAAWKSTEFGNDIMFVLLDIRWQDVLDIISQSENPDFLVGITDLVMNCCKQGRLEMAKELCIYGLKLSRWKLGPDHPQTLRIMSALGSVYRDEEKLNQTEEVYIEVWKMSKSVLGEHNPDTLYRASALASVYHSQGRLKEAEELYTQVLESTKRVFGEEHPDTLYRASALASVYHSQGRLEEAEELYTQVLELIKRVFGEEHPNTLYRASALASVSHSQGRLKEAEELYTQVLESTKRVFGEEHLNTIATIQGLASVYMLQGRFGLASDLLNYILPLSEKIFGSTHEQTLTSIDDMAKLNVKLGKLEEAEALYHRALNLRDKNLGPKHLRTLETSTGLAMVLAKQSKLTEAELLYEKALRGKEEILGPTHFSTIETANALADLSKRQGRLAEAEAMYERVLRGRIEIWGPDHALTIEAVSHLGELYLSRGKLANAEKMYQRVLEGADRAFGPVHPLTLDTCRNLGRLLKDLGRVDEAESMLKRALEGYQQRFGNNHQTTEEVFQALAELRKG